MNPRITPDSIRFGKGRTPRWLAVTAYDFPTAKFLDEEGVDIIHVGDSLGMMVLGHPDTTRVTLPVMSHHTAAVAGAKGRALITSDLPIATYRTPDEAVASSRELMRAGADAVKMEGGREILDQIRAVLGEGIPVQGHIGMLPQQAPAEGGFKKKGKTEDDIRRLCDDASALGEAGCFSIVVECVTPEAAHAITRACTVPTIGIASGTGCDGEIRVFHDIMGLYPWFRPPFVKVEADLGAALRQGVRSLREKVG